MYKLLEKINTPSDLKKLSLDELVLLSEEVRCALFNRLTKKGGHFGSNFGTVEVEIAMHYVFDSPKDKFVFDVSHQSYTHKILTGRKNAFINDDEFKTVTGYTNPKESEHDFFEIGHTSTSISLASGLAKSRDLKKENGNIVAVIGDGSLSGGEAFEGLNVVGGELKSNFILIINDNNFSIAETHGAMSDNLKKLRETKGLCDYNIFKCFGFDYIYEENGNDVKEIVKLFNKVKNIDHPIALHICTKKGSGYEIAEKDGESWHWCEPFDVKTGKPTYEGEYPESYFDVIHSYVMDRARKDKDFLFITPSYPGGALLSKEDRKELGQKYVDVGIAEEHAVAMASGASKNGSNVMVLTDVSFIQRAYDQISQDLCLNSNPATILLEYSFVGCEERTHLSIFMQSILPNIPNLIVLAPTCKKELVAMLDWSLTQKENPVVIFTPRGDLSNRDVNVDFSNKKYLIENVGRDIAIFAVGGMFEKAIKLSSEIKQKLGINVSLINPRFISELDVETLNMIKKDHKIILTLEESLKYGGFGEKISDFYSTCSEIKVKNYAFDKMFYDEYDENKLFNINKMTNDNIISDLSKM